MDRFASQEDIINRGLELVGAAPITSLTDGSRNANLVAPMYDKLRLSELRRNMWTFACRRTRLWPISTTSLLVTFPAWAVGTTYNVGDLVLGPDGFTVWTSKITGNVGNSPGSDTSGALAWDVFFGPQVAQYWNLPVNPPTANSTNTAYDAGEIVYIITGAGTYNVYQSLISNNQAQPNTPDTWSNSQMYAAGDVVTLNGTNFQSLVNQNYNQTPSGITAYWTTVISNPTVSRSWRQITGATLASLLINWPLQSSPFESANTPNAFMLPFGFMREAPQNPGAGRVSSYLGMPRNPVATDWEHSGNFLVSMARQPIEYRFIADVQDVTTMDPMFCMGLGARVGHAAARTLSYEPAIVAEALAEYKRIMEEARIQNAIEQGAIMPPLDDFIAGRI